MYGFAAVGLKLQTRKIPGKDHAAAAWPYFIDEEKVTLRANEIYIISFLYGKYRALFASRILSVKYINVLRYVK